MEIERGPLRARDNLERVRAAGRRLGGLDRLAGSLAIGIVQRAGLAPAKPNERLGTPDESWGLESLEKYQGGHFVVVGASGMIDKGREVADAIAASGILEEVRAIGIAPLAPRINQEATVDQRERLIDNVEHVRDELSSMDTGTVVRAIKSPIIVAPPKERGGSLTQQAYSGVRRVIKSFEKSLDPEILSHDDELAMAVVTPPLQAERALEVPHGLVIRGGIIVLNKVGSVPQENEWLEQPHWV